MYRQIFSKVNRQVTLNLPAAWADKDVEVLAYPVTEATQQPQLSQDEQAMRFRELLEFNRKYSFSTKNFKFDRDEANDYDND